MCGCVKPEDAFTPSLIHRRSHYPSRLYSFTSEASMTISFRTNRQGRQGRKGRPCIRDHLLNQPPALAVREIQRACVVTIDFCFFPFPCVLGVPGGERSFV